MQTPQVKHQMELDEVSTQKPKADPLRARAETNYDKYLKLKKVCQSSTNIALYG